MLPSKPEVLISPTDITAIPKANLGFSTTPSSPKLTLGECDNDRQPKIAIYWNRIGTLPARLPRSNAVGSLLEF